MMSWLRSNNPVIERKKVEPGATFSLLENHWKQATEVMDKSGDSLSEAALTVISHLNQMISFLRLARTEDPEQNCKQFWIRNRCSDKVIKWLHGLQIQGMQLQYDDEVKLVQTLQSLCELASKDGEMLGYVNSENDLGAESWDGACSLSSLLLEYSLKSDPYLGEPARNSFIHLIQLASRFPGLEQSFSKETGLGLTNVVISGLSACFAQLPTFACGTAEQLDPLITQLKFVDSVTHAAPPKVSTTIAECLTNVFLNAVILPALTQDEGNRSLHREDDQFATSLHEEIAIVTDYLKIVCEYLTHPLLIRSLITFVTSSLLPVFIKRMNHPNTAVTISTLGLLSVLLEFYCEDFWYELLLRHLMPQNHLMVSQRSSRHSDVNFEEASVRFLSLIPGPALEAMGSEAVTYHYTQYLTNELSRWSNFDALSFCLTPPSSPTSGEGSSSSTNQHIKNHNPVFPMWKFKYDGTDAVIEYGDKDSLVEEPPSTSFTSKVVEVKGQETETDPLTSVEGDMEEETNFGVKEQAKSPVFTTISLQPIGEEINIDIGISDTSLNEVDSVEMSDRIGEKNIFSHINTNTNTNSDGYGSLDINNGAGNGGTEHPASFGPFLDTLLYHLSNLSRLPPDVVLMVTEIMSTLAASRIPIVSSLIIDPNIILQPSFISFPLLLNRIRIELEQTLKNNQSVLREVWGSMSRDLQPVAKSPRDSLVNSLSSTFDSSLSFGDNSFTDNLRKKITSSNSFTAALNQVFRKSTGNSSQHEGQGQVNLNDSVQSVDTRSSRYVNRSPSGPQTAPQSSEAIKMMATRAIFFSHWLLELGAIAQQLSWKRPSV